MPRIVTLSDTHNQLRKIVKRLPEGDILVHAGDLCGRGVATEFHQEMNVLLSLRDKYKNVIVIPGNHDICVQDTLDSKPASIERMVEDFGQMGVDFLIDRAVERQGLKFYGSPWQTWFYDWAFNFPMKERNSGETAQAKWAEIPDDTQVLITHGPPAGILDAVIQYGVEDDRVGDYWLMARIRQLESLRLHVFGHIHESNGKEEFMDLSMDVSAQPFPKITFVNASICDREYYNPVQEIHVVDL